MRRRYLAALCGAAIVCGAMPATASAKLKIGVTDIAQQNRSPAFFWQNVKKYKMSIIRTQVSWKDIARHKPKNPEDPNDPAYNWRTLDKNVRDGAAWATLTGGTVIYNVWGTPRWAQKYKRNVLFVAVPNTTAFRQFMRAVAKRYSGTFTPNNASVTALPLPRIRYYEIWNEPNNALGLAKPSSKEKRGVPAGASAYRALLNTAFNVLHDPRFEPASGPKNVVIGGAVGGRTGINHVKFYSALKKQHARMDAISVHPYSLVPKWGPSDGAPGKGYLQPYYRLGNFNRFVGFVRGWRGKKFPIYVTEIGWQVNPPDKRLGVSPKQQGSFLKQAVSKLKKYPQVAGMTWYLLRDERTMAGWQSGTYSNRGSAKRPRKYMNLAWKAVLH
jgi:hypothetical protein